MIIQGKDGSLLLFWNDLLISSFPLGLNKLKDYKVQSENLIIDSFKSNRNIKKQIQVYKCFCQLIYNKKKNKEKISGFDHQRFCACVFSLIRFKFVDEDDVIFIAPRKKNYKRGKRFIQHLPF